MEFYIKQNSTLPVLKMEIIKDGRSDFNLNSFLSASTTFLISLYDKSKDIFLFASKECYITTEYSEFESKNLYYLNYQFTGKDTLRSGRYEVQVSIPTENGVILLPLQDKFFVNVVPSSLPQTVNYSDSNYVANLPCCGFQQTYTYNQITIQAYYNPGSLVVDYFLNSTQSYNYPITISFSNELLTYSGNSIFITTGITLQSGQLTSGLQIIFDEINFSNLTQIGYLRNVSFNLVPDNNIFNLSDNVFFATLPPSPTPTQTITPTNTQTTTPTNTQTSSVTPTNTNTPTPTESPTNTPTLTLTQTPTITNTETPTNTPTPSITTTQTETQFLTPSVTQTNTPTPTETPTNTPTNTETTTNTPTPSNTETTTPTPTNTPTVTQTPTNTLTPTVTPNTCKCYNFFNTGTTTSSNVNYIDCSGVLSQITIQAGDYGQACVRNEQYTASTTPIGVTYLLGDCTSGCPTISADTCTPFFLNSNDRIIYSYNPDTNTQIPLPIGLSGSTLFDIATNDNLLWVYGTFIGGTTGIREYTITRNPFSATLNRFISLTSAPYASVRNGLAVVNNTTLLSSSGANGTAIVTLDITTSSSTPTLLFNLPSDRALRGDFIYTSTGKVIVSTFNITAGTGSFITQFDYSGTRELEFSNGNNANGWGLYIYNSQIVAVVSGAAPATRWQRATTSPYTITTLTSMTAGNIGFAQPLSCLNVNFT